MSHEDRLELPERILDRAAEMPAGYEVLSDEDSRQEFRAQIRWRCLLDDACLAKPHAASDMYFDPRILTLSDKEVLVDCGAFDGDSIRAFLEKTRGRFRHIVNIEPDPVNRAALEQYVRRLPASQAACITVLPYAVAGRTGTVRFKADGFAGSKIGEAGATLDVECRTLDTMLANGAPPTLIKMDIEGAEPEATLGAAEIIRRHRPAMIVCAYHKCDHLWVLPKLLHDACPDYRIYLRRYAEDCWETVYYAVPPERMLNRSGWPGEVRQAFIQHPESRAGNNSI